jgi:hypothetical protein
MPSTKRPIEGAGGFLAVNRSTRWAWPPVEERDIYWFSSLALAGPSQGRPLFMLSCSFVSPRLMDRQQRCCAVGNALEDTDLLVVAVERSKAARATQQMASTATFTEYGREGIARFHSFFSIMTIFVL